MLSGSPGGPGAVLWGREAEQALVGRVLSRARAGSSAVLVLRGDPGIGKTALLEQARAAATGMTVLRCTGVQTESELPFAALHQLLHPVLDRLDALPTVQSAALRAALGLGPTAGGDQLLVGVAVLSLLAELADERPVACLVDDAHWLDHASAQALRFAARRLRAEAVALLFAARDGFDPAGLPTHRLPGLSPAAAAHLVASWPAPVRARVIAEAAGNPLALLELPRSLPDHRPLPLPARIQEAFAARLDALPPAARAALLLTAADDEADLATLLRAGCTLEALATAERAGLIQVADGRVTFTHPLLRAAAYRHTTFDRRLAAHRTLAAAVDAPDRRAWHLASAATGPDEEAAAALELAAGRARGRKGYAATAAALRRAAELSPDGPRRIGRLIAAAEAADAAGHPDEARSLLDRLPPDAFTPAAPPPAEDHALPPATALPPGEDRVPSSGAGPPPAEGHALAPDALTPGTAPSGEGRAISSGAGPPSGEGRAISSGAGPRPGASYAAASALRAKLAFDDGDAAAAHDLLVSGAAELAATSRSAAGLMLVDAARNAWLLGDVPRRVEAGRLLHALGLRAAGGLDAAVAAVSGGGGSREGLAALGELVAAGRTNADDPPNVRLNAAFVAGLIGDFEASREISAAVAARSRAEGAVGRLPRAHVTLAAAELYLGRFRDAVTTAAEGLQLAADAGGAGPGGQLEGILAWIAAARGETDECVRLAAGADPAWAAWALALLDLGQGRAAEASDRLEAALAGPAGRQIQSVYFAPDQVEAAIRAGHRDRAESACARFESWASTASQAWAAAVAHRCRALLSPSLEGSFAEAVRLHAGGERPWEAARTRLAFGERLRRERRKTEARTHLRAAAELFDRLGAAPWSDRARAELRAAGEQSTPAPAGDLLAALSPQELQIVRLVAAGRTNREIAAMLFISPRTVSHHLYRAFPKLNVASRTQLARLDLT